MTIAATSVQRAMPGQRSTADPATVLSRHVQKLSYAIHGVTQGPMEVVAQLDAIIGIPYRYRAFSGVIFQQDADLGAGAEFVPGREDPTAAQTGANSCGTDD